MTRSLRKAFTKMEVLFQKMKEQMKKIKGQLTGSKVQGVKAQAEMEDTGQGQNQITIGIRILENISGQNQEVEVNRARIIRRDQEDPSLSREIEDDPGKDADQDLAISRGTNLTTTEVTMVNRKDHQRTRNQSIGLMENLLLARVTSFLTVQNQLTKRVGKMRHSSSSKTLAGLR